MEIKMELTENEYEILEHSLIKMIQFSVYGSWYYLVNEQIRSILRKLRTAKEEEKEYGTEQKNNI